VVAIIVVDGEQRLEEVAGDRRCRGVSGILDAGARSSSTAGAAGAAGRACGTVAAPIPSAPMRGTWTALCAQFDGIQ
jgi:hypothetical protein